MRSVTVEATAVCKGIEMTHGNSFHYLTFELDSGERMYFQVSIKCYMLITEGDRCIITYKDNNRTKKKLKSFERIAKAVPISTRIQVPATRIPEPESLTREPENPDQESVAVTEEPKTLAQKIEALDQEPEEVRHKPENQSSQKKKHTNQKKKHPNKKRKKQNQTKGG